MYQWEHVGKGDASTEWIVNFSFLGESCGYITEGWEQSFKTLRTLRTRVSHLVHRHKAWFLLTNHPSLVDMWLTTDFFLGHFWRDKQIKTMGGKNPQLSTRQERREFGRKTRREYRYQTFCCIKCDLDWLWIKKETDYFEHNYVYINKCEEFIIGLSTENRSIQNKPLAGLSESNYERSLQVSYRLYNLNIDIILKCREIHRKCCIFTAIHCDLSKLKFTVLITTLRVGHSRIICFTCIYMTGFVVVVLFFFFILKTEGKNWKHNIDG